MFATCTPFSLYGGFFCVQVLTLFGVEEETVSLLSRGAGPSVNSTIDVSTQNSCSEQTITEKAPPLKLLYTRHVSLSWIVCLQVREIHTGQ